MPSTPRDSADAVSDVEETKDGKSKYKAVKKRRGWTLRTRSNAVWPPKIGVRLGASSDAIRNAERCRQSASATIDVLWDAQLAAKRAFKRGHCP